MLAARSLREEEVCRLDIAMNDPRRVSFDEPLARLSDKAKREFGCDWADPRKQTMEILANEVFHDEEGFPRIGVTSCVHESSNVVGVDGSRGSNLMLEATHEIRN